MSATGKQPEINYGENVPSEIDGYQSYGWTISCATSRRRGMRMACRFPSRINNSSFS